MIARSVAPRPCRAAPLVGASRRRRACRSAGVPSPSAHRHRRRQSTAVRHSFAPVNWTRSPLHRPSITAWIEVTARSAPRSRRGCRRPIDNYPSGWSSPAERGSGPSPPGKPGNTRSILCSAWLVERPSGRHCRIRIGTLVHNADRGRHDQRLLRPSGGQTGTLCARASRLRHPNRPCVAPAWCSTSTRVCVDCCEWTRAGQD